MKTSKRNKLLGLVLTGSFGLLGATGAFAAANDDITNRATLSYDVGAVPQTVIESADGVGNSNPGVGSGGDTLFKEDRVINFTVTQEAGQSVPVSPGSTNAENNEVSFLIENLGNAPQGFLLRGVHNLGGTDPYTPGLDVFTPTNIRTFVDVNNDGQYVLADDGAVEFVATVAVGTTVRVFVITDIPTLRTDTNPIQNDDLSVVSLVAQVSVDGTTGIIADAITNDDNGNTSPGGTFSAAGLIPAGGAVDIGDDPATMQTVYNDPAGTENGVGAAGATQNGQSADVSSYIIETAVLTISKNSQVIYDPVNLDNFTAGNNPKALPSAFIQYTINIRNDAPLLGASADLTTLVDAIVTTGSADVNLDTDLLNAGIVLPPILVPANNENGGGDAVRIDTTGTSRPSAGLTYCLGAGAGCSYSGDPSGSVTVTFTTIAGMAAEGTYTAGELKPQEDIDIVFNVIVQ